MFREENFHWEKISKPKTLDKRVEEEIPENPFKEIEYVVFNIDFRRFGDSNDKFCRIKNSKYNYSKKKWYYDLVEVKSIKNPVETGRKFIQIPQENLIDSLELRRY